MRLASILLLTTLAVASVYGAWLEATNSLGARTTHLLSSSTTTGGKVVHATTVGNEIYLVELVSRPAALPPAAPRVANVVGRRVQSVENLVGPIGCDNTDASKAVITSNCAANSVAAKANMDDVRRTWYMPPRSDACVLAGGTPSSCLGPVLGLGTDTDVLFAGNRVFIPSASGYNGAIPSVVVVDMALPKLLVTSACIAANISSTTTFAAPYTPFEYDMQSGADPLIWRTFQRSDGILKQMTVSLVRTTVFSDDFRIALGDGSALFFLSAATFYGNGTRLWASLVPFEVSIPMLANSGGLSNCAMVLGVQPAPYPPQLNPVYPVTSTNYLQQPSVPRFYTTMSCSFSIGELDGNNNLVRAGCTDRKLCGGYATYVVDYGTYDVPVFVPADSRYDDYVEDDCESFYPLATTFKGFGLGGGDGPTYSRHVAAEEMCYAPFYSIDKILANDFVEERERQCRVMGMRTAGPTRDHCQAPYTRRQCKKGWHIHDDFCYYKFDATTDAKFAVVDTEAQAACESIPFGDGFATAVKVEVLTSADHDLRVRLQTWLTLIGRKDSVPPGPPYRVPVPDTNDCYWFTYIQGTPDLGESAYAMCKAPAYPVCRYHIKHYEVVDRYVSHSVKTIRLLRDGQAGTPWTGTHAKCNCFPGSYGEFCKNHDGCPIDNAFPNALADAATDPLVLFYLRCTAGKCKDSQPRTCACDADHGPSASLIPLSQFYAYRDFACACPASSDSTGTFSVNGVSYSGIAMNLPCGGSARGACTVDAFSNVGRCASVQVWDESANASVAVYGGPATTCAVPKVPVSGYVLDYNIRAEVCNGKGVCSGSGCSCEEGWAGDACTCPSPVDYAAGTIPTVSASHSVFVDLGTTLAVVRVLVSAQPAGIFLGGNAGCNATSVTLANAAVSPSTTRSCSLSTVDGVAAWTCPGEPVFQYVLLRTTEAAPRCVVRAFTDTRPPCGDNTNPTAHRFIARHFGNGSYPREQDPFSFGAACTRSTCLCDQDHTGLKCANAVSSVEIGEDGGITKVVCGESTLPKRGSPGTDGCMCNAVSSIGAVGFGGLPLGTFTEEACECQEWFVQERNQRMQCAGHGRCVKAKFPWGTCAADLDAFESDSLAFPFVRVPHGCHNASVRVVERGKFLRTGASNCSSEPVDAYSWNFFGTVTPSQLVNGERWFRADGTALNLLNQKAVDDFIVLFTTPGVVPVNLPLRTAYQSVAGAWSRVVDMGKPEDVAFIATVQHAFLDKRKCTADNECESFGLGVCVFDSSDWVPWRNGDPAVPTYAVGDSGGCAPFEDFSRGFWDGQLFCRECRDGYGPKTQADWLTVVSHQARLLAVTGPGVPSLYDASVAPFAPVSGNQIDHLNSTVYCRLPWSAGTDGHLCGGFGTVGMTVSTSATVMTVFGTTTARCINVTIDGTAMAGTPLGEDIYRYVSSGGDSGLNVVGGTPYFWGTTLNTTAGVLDSCVGTTCDFLLEGSGERKSVRCWNPALYAAPAHVDAYDGGGNLVEFRERGSWSLVLG